MCGNVVVGGGERSEQCDSDVQFVKRRLAVCTTSPATFFCSGGEADAQL
jgi:hypothetical protein